MAVPRLRQEKCFMELDPRRPGITAAAATIKGAGSRGRAVGPEEMKPLDLVLVGSVAVDRRGGRVGKGGGFSDLEYAIARRLGLLSESTPIVTTVHPLQVLDEPVPMTDHDIPVDWILTPSETIETGTKHPRPKGIRWDLLAPEQLKDIPILQRFRPEEL